MRFNDVIKLLYERKGFRNREQAAEYLGMTAKGLQAIKAGRGALKDSTIDRLMEGTGLEAWQIVAAWEAEHGRTEAVRESWRRFLKSVAAVILCAVGIAQPVDSNATIGHSPIGHVRYYANLLRGWARRLGLLAFRRYNPLRIFHLRYVALRAL